MTINVNLLPENGGMQASPLRAGLPAVSAAGVNDAGTIARQQLPSAVPAPSQVAAYAPYVPQPKPIIRSPSSALAAQLIAQGALVSEEDQALFEPAKPATSLLMANDAAADDFIATLRMARGEFAQELTPRQKAAAASVKPTSTASQSQAAERSEISSSDNTTAVTSEKILRSGTAQFASSLPALVIPFARKPSLTQVRGIGAYQLAANRNAGIKREIAATAD